MQFDIDFVTAAQCCCNVASYCKTANKDEPRPDFLLGNLPQDVHCADYKRGDNNNDNNNHNNNKNNNIDRSNYASFFCILKHVL